MARNPLHPNRIASLPRGKKHWRWSENPSLLALHKRLHREFGPAKKYPCAESGCPNKANDYANVTGKYSDNIKDYLPLCRSHHVKRDKNWIKKP